MSKKSYMSLLKEAIAEFDTSDTVEVKGPMLDPILSWDGDGELPIYKDAASILERYYFNEDKETRVNTLDEADYENDDGNPASGPAMKNAKGAGTEQAGTSDAGSIKGGKAEKEKDIAKESEEIDEQEWSDKDLPEAKEYTDEGVEMENAIIEKLIAEMEDENDDDDDDDDEDVSEMDMTYTGKGPKVSMPDEKEANDPEQHTTGAGTEQAGTGDAEGQIPPRKDLHDKFVKAKEYTDENEQIEAALAQLEQELMEADDEMGDDADADEEVEKDLDVDKAMTKESSSVPGGPSPKKRGEDWESDEAAYSEAFDIFQEAISEQEDEDDDDEKEGVKEAWNLAINEDVKSIIENNQLSLLDEALTAREKTFLFGRIQRVFGDCAKKCGRIAVTSKQRACKDLCIAKRDQAIKAAREKVKAATASAKGKTDKAAKFTQKAKDIESY